MKHASLFWLLPLLGLTTSASAGPLIPGAFSSLGNFNKSSGTFTVDTDALTLTGSDGTNLTGVLSDDRAVFNFSGLNLGSGTSLFATGSRGVALLSTGNISISGSVNVSANGSTQAGAGGQTGAAFGFSTGGGSGTGSAVTNGLDGQSTDLGLATGSGSHIAYTGGGGGANFVSGGGGGGFSYTTGSGSGSGTVTTTIVGGSGGFGGGAGGFGTYTPAGGSSSGTLSSANPTGGGAGGASFDASAGDVIGGAGGGALEIGASGDVEIAGSLLAAGGDGSDGTSTSLTGTGGGAGGGGGGSIWVYGDNIIIEGLLDVSGGDGGDSVGGAAGGNGGAGSISIIGNLYDIALATLDVSSGTVGSGFIGGGLAYDGFPAPDGQVLLTGTEFDGEITSSETAVIPGDSTLPLLLTGLLLSAGVRARRA